VAEQFEAKGYTSPRDSDEMLRSMATPVEIAVATYVRAAEERDPARRAQLLEACFAEDGRMVTAGREIRGRAAVADMLTRAHVDPKFAGVRLTSAVDARGTIFRYQSVVDFRDGTSAAFFDAGEIDASGRIVVLLTFSGPLGDAP
jgi:hypothetical protein